jgi:hypothetical protein
MQRFLVERRRAYRRDFASQRELHRAADAFEGGLAGNRGELPERQVVRHIPV